MGHPTLNWRDVTGLLKAKFDLAVQNNEVTISVETEKSDAESVQQSMIRALDMADSTISLISFRESIGLTVVIDNFEDGRTEDVFNSEPQLSELATAVKSEIDLVTIMKLMLVEPNLFLAIRDLADSLKFLHAAKINCARAMDSIRHYFVPEGRGRDGWLIMRQSLNVSEQFLRSITEASRGPRHGDRPIDTDPNIRAIGIKAWQVMNRFLEYRKRGNQPLSIDEFPLLD